MFYEKYRELCAKNGLSPTGVARKVGISSRTAADWAFGSEPRPATVKKIADFFGVDVSVFYQEDPPAKDDGLIENFVNEIMAQKTGLSDDENLIIMAYRTMSDYKKTKVMQYIFKLTLEKEDETR